MMVDGRARVIIENITPAVDGGRYAAKRVVGDEVMVAVDMFADGHDELRGELLYRPPQASTRTRVPLVKFVNDQWRGAFVASQVGEYRFSIRGWVDPYRTWLRDLRKRLGAGQSIAVDFQIGVQAMRELLAENPRAVDAVDDLELSSWIETFSGDPVLALERLGNGDGWLALMDRVAAPRHATQSAVEYRLCVDPVRGACGAWYEMFPRSAALEPGRAGNLRDVIIRLPYVAEMGFDILYLPPIHPIGRQFRKGKNNLAEAAAGDVGSPWAIGSAEGGHKSVHPELGTLDDFNELVRRAAGYGLQIAMDLALQCSPDHPYVREHPNWFRHRPDGTIQYAENPPKKYQDIYPFDFETSDWKALWDELKSIFTFWIEQGVRIFRVDNPHAKPFVFWEWCLGELKREHPDLIFLAEAFTRPKPLHCLAKLGFTQSYTYFAWRNTKAELTDYVTRLVHGETREYLRPNFWPNTPDILPEALQVGGRAQFLSRLALAATLGASYGIYGPPFEHGWSEPLQAGSEEYLHSEKYQVHHHDLTRADSLRGVIARVNRIRRENPALQRNDSLQFHSADNDQLLCYSKHDRAADNVVIAIVNLDPHFRQSGFIELPLAALGIDDRRPYQVHDLLTDARFLWHGARNYVELDPHKLPFHLFRVRRHVRTEHDFEYYL